MNCSKCSSPQTRCVDSRPLDSGKFTRRRYECNKCAARFTTIEITVPGKIKTGRKIGRPQTVLAFLKSASTQELLNELTERNT